MSMSGACLREKDSHRKNEPVQNRDMPEPIGRAHEAAELARDPAMQLLREAERGIAKPPLRPELQPQRRPAANPPPIHAEAAPSPWAADAPANETASAPNPPKIVAALVLADPTRRAISRDACAKGLPPGDGLPMRPMDLMDGSQWEPAPSKRFMMNFDLSARRSVGAEEANDKAASLNAVRVLGVGS